MTVETFAVVSANAVVVMAAVWRMSALLAKIETQLSHLIKDYEEDKQATNARLNSHEARILNLERGK